MARELCPRCQAIRNMRLCTSRRKVAGPDGKTRKVITKVYHCETCNTFVKSEDIEVENQEETGDE